MLPFISFYCFIQTNETFKQESADDALQDAEDDEDEMDIVTTEAMDREQYRAPIIVSDLIEQVGDCRPNILCVSLSSALACIPVEPT
jgi:hypothetical protein